MYYVYVLKQRGFDHYYVGYTNNIERRFKEHQQGLSKSTQGRHWSIKYYFATLNKNKAKKFERYLKSGSGRAFTVKHFN